MAKRIVVTNEEGRTRLARDMEGLKYHIGAMNKHGTLARAIATEYRMITATGLSLWRARWADSVYGWTTTYIQNLLSHDESEPRDHNGNVMRYGVALRWRRRRAAALKKAKASIRRERMK